MATRWERRSPSASGTTSRRTTAEPERNILHRIAAVSAFGEYVGVRVHYCASCRLAMRAAASFLPKDLRAAMAGRWLARGRALPASQL